MSDFPRTVDEITPEWLTKVLRESGAKRDASVESIEVSGLDGGIHGEVNRISLNYDRRDAVAPNSVVVKLSLEDDEKRESVRERELSKREVGSVRTQGTGSVRCPIQAPIHLHLYSLNQRLLSP